MGAASNLLGVDLVGGRDKRKWRVVEKLPINDDLSAPSYSVGYKVLAEDGQRAFLKASDLGLVTNTEGSMLERAQAAMSAYQFERDILEHCRGSNMHRIVTAIDFGEVMQVFEGAREPVFFLVFELATCDARVHVNTNKKFDLAWCVNALHDLAIAIRQLHNGEICHNDIKPANLLVFDKLLRKLADLGKATTPNQRALHDEDIVVGDYKYASPEVLYAQNLSSYDPKILFRDRRACDLYHLGSMAFYFVCGQMITPAVIYELMPEHRPGDNGWTGSFENIIPYWRDAFGHAITKMDRFLPTESDGSLTRVASDLRTAIIQLTEVDPRQRGHPMNRRQNFDQYSVERYISLFERLRKEAVIRR